MQTYAALLFFCVRFLHQTKTRRRLSGSAFGSQRRAGLFIVISSFSFIPRSVLKRRKVIPARSYLTPSICLVLFQSLPSLLSLSTASLPVHVSLHPSIFLSVCHSQSFSPFFLSFSFTLSKRWLSLSLKVMEAGVCGSQRARLGDYTAACMKDS